MTIYKNAVWKIRKSPDGKEVEKNISVEINGVSSFVPLDPANSDYAEMLKQVKEGTLTIKDAD